MFQQFSVELNIHVAFKRPSPQKKIQYCDDEKDTRWLAGGG
jgi:hypothetical protein